MNQVVLVGNLTDDVELPYAESGPAVANFTVADSRKQCHDGSWRDVIDGFFRCTA
jgi:single-stranded DNA-binding protein